MVAAMSSGKAGSRSLAAGEPAGKAVGRGGSGWGGGAGDWTAVEEATAAEVDEAGRGGNSDVRGAPRAQADDEGGRSKAEHKLRAPLLRGRRCCSPKGLGFHGEAMGVNVVLTATVPALEGDFLEFLEVHR